MIVKIENLGEEKKFGKLINELKPNNSEFKKILTELQGYIATNIPVKIQDDKVEEYLKNPYPIAISLYDCEFGETDLQNAVDWGWYNKVNLEENKSIHCVTVSEFEEMFFKYSDITVEYLSKLTVNGKLPQVTVLDEEDGDAQVEWEFAGDELKKTSRINISRFDKNSHWTLFFCYCDENQRNDIDLDVTFVGMEEFASLFAFVSKRMERIVNSWGCD